MSEHDDDIPALGVRDMTIAGSYISRMLGEHTLQSVSFFLFLPLPSLGDFHLESVSFVSHALPNHESMPTDRS
jgi:hypothetical protein